MPSAYFVVRATVADAAKRKAFDEWYETSICRMPPRRSA